MDSNFYLIRHAQAQINLVDVVGGRTNHSPLTLEGIEQAIKLEKRLTKVKFDYVLCSPSVRTDETMRISLMHKNRIDITFLLELQELSQGDWEGKPRKEIYTPEILAVINRDHWNFAPPKGESQKNVAARVKNVLEGEANRRAGEYLVYTHGGAIKYFLADIDYLPKEEAWKSVVENTSVTKVRYNSGKWEVDYYNDFSHLTFS